MRRAVLAILAATALSACGLQLKQPKLEPNGVRTAEDAWSSLLNRAVDAKGRVDYEALRKEPRDLQYMVSWLSTLSPETDPQRFPTAASKLAYYVNAYNAMALYAVVVSDLRPEDHRRFYSRAKLMIGGSLSSLSDLESKVADLKDPRAYFALCGAAAGDPRLAPVPYSAASVEAQLDSAAKTFLNDPRNVKVDFKRRVVILTDYIQTRKSAMKAGAASLLAFLNRYRDDKLPEAYKIEFVPRDLSLNTQTSVAVPAVSDAVPGAAKGAN